MGSPSDRAAASILRLAGELPVVTLPSGEQWPALGQGTWTLAEREERRPAEIAALRTGIDLGMTVIDTAEEYGAGRAESLVGEAVAGLRDRVVIVSKVLPANGSREGVIAACENSLRRLVTDRIDLYLLHWPRDDGPVTDETFEAFQALVGQGKIRYWGVSNFSYADIEELERRPWGANVTSDQVLYNLRRRVPELELLPWSVGRSVPIMAYSPIEGGRMLTVPALQLVAARHDATAAQVALAWLLRRPGVIAIPKSGSEAHTRENREAASIDLTADDLAELDVAFPAPTVPAPFEMG